MVCLSQKHSRREKRLLLYIDFTILFHVFRFREENTSMILKNLSTFILLVLLFFVTQQKRASKTIQVFVALCDNQYQGIVKFVHHPTRHFASNGF